MCSSPPHSGNITTVAQPSKVSSPDVIVTFIDITVCTPPPLERVYLTALQSMPCLTINVQVRGAMQSNLWINIWCLTYLNPGMWPWAPGPMTVQMPWVKVHDLDSCSNMFFWSNHLSKVLNECPQFTARSRLFTSLGSGLIDASSHVSWWWLGIAVSWLCG